MKLTVVGCAGSFPGPDSPASCYLLEAPHEGGTFKLLMDLGSGSLGNLQRFTDMRDIDAIVISHLHADHCFDLCGLYVVSKYHPDGPYDRIPLLAPAGAEPYLSSAYGLDDGVGMTEQFDFQEWHDGQDVQLGPFTVMARRVVHPVPAFGIRISTGDRSIVYSGDTGPTDLLYELVEDADVFLAEASFVESAENPPDLHLTGAEAGRYATVGGVKRLLITHIPAWTDAAEVASDVKTTWDGPVELVAVGSTYDI